MTDDLRTLGILFAAWTRQHCSVAAGIYRGDPFIMDGWQLTVAVNHYAIKPRSIVDPTKLLDPFVYRRSVVVGPQKSGKSPMAAAMTLFEAVGPSLFDGWAEAGDVYRCSDHGCGCGWEYEYLPGEAMGRPREQSLIGIMATAEDQVANIYTPLQEMVRSGPLDELIKVREGFMRLPNGGRIDALTAAAKSKLGKPLTFAAFDESGIYTGKILEAYQTIRRSLAGTQGRSCEFTNPWDPMENSAAQRSFESRSTDIYRYYNKPPADLSYSNKAERHKIHVYVYRESPWVNVKDIDAEAAELVETDPTQAERFFGNRLVQGLGTYMPERVWDETQAEVEVPEGTEITLGFDGSASGDWTAIRACTIGRYRFTPTYGPDKRPTVWDPAQWPDGRIPRGEVDAAMREMFAKYKVKRLYIDPRHWETQADSWAEAFGEDVVVVWPTNIIGRMFPALVRYLEDSHEKITTHDADPVAQAHAFNARKVAKPGDKFILGKPSEHQKIDVLMADILAYEAAADAHATGWAETDNRMFVFR